MFPIRENAPKLRRFRKLHIRLFDVASEMDIEDRVIWVYGVGDDSMMALADFGTDNLIVLI